MTEKDRRLIEEARRLPSRDWSEIVEYLIPRAETSEAEAELRSIANWKYHKDEFGVGAL